MKITGSMFYLAALLPLLGGCNNTQNITDTNIPESDCQMLPDSATFTVKGNEVVMNGSIDCSTQDKLTKILDNNESISTLVLNFVPGSGDDEANLKLGRMVNSRRLNTRIPDFSASADDPEEVLSGLVASGGVDLFLSGINRSIGTNVCIGVHSWADSDGNEGSDYAENNAAHKDYIQYYADVGYSKGWEFYFFTLQAQDADGMHYMDPSELKNWHIETSNQLTGACSLSELQPYME